MKDAPFLCWLILTDQEAVKTFFQTFTAKNKTVSFHEENYSFFRALENQSWHLVIIDSGIWSYLPEDTRERLRVWRSNQPENQIFSVIYLESEQTLSEKKLLKNLSILNKGDQLSPLTSGDKTILFDALFFWQLGEAHLVQILEAIEHRLILRSLSLYAPFVDNKTAPFPLLSGESEEASNLVASFDLARNATKITGILGNTGSLGDDLAYLIHKWRSTSSGSLFLRLPLENHTRPPFTSDDLYKAPIRTILFTQVPEIRSDELGEWVSFSNQLSQQGIKVIWNLEGNSATMINRVKRLISQADWIQIPNLTDRSFDIPSMVDQYLKELDSKGQVDIANSVIQNLLNQRSTFSYLQLKNLTLTWISYHRRRIQLPDLPSGMITHVKGWHELLRTLPFPQEGISFAKIEKELLARSLKEADYSIARAARNLQIGRKAFLYRLKKHDIPSEKN